MSVTLKKVAYYAIEDGSNILSQWMKSLCVTIQQKLVMRQYFAEVLLIMLFKKVLTLESVDETNKLLQSPFQYFQSWWHWVIKKDLKERDAKISWN